MIFCAVAFACIWVWAAGAAEPPIVSAPASTSAPGIVLVKSPVQQLDEIRVTPKIETEDRKPREKTPLQKMHDFLDKRGKSIGTTVRESPTADGRRIAQVNIGERIFCIEDRRGLIDFAGMGRGGMAMHPVGDTCQ